MRKLFFSALVALVAGSAAFASLGNKTDPTSAYFKNALDLCEEVDDCTITAGTPPCGEVTPNVYYNQDCDEVLAYYR